MPGFFDRLWGQEQRAPEPQPVPDPPLPIIPNVPEITARELKALLESSEPPFVVDVREPFEWHDGGIPGAAQMPMNTVPARLDDLPRDRHIVAYCHVGERSWYVAEFLLRNGYERVSSLAGGIEAWRYFQRFGG